MGYGRLVKTVGEIGSSPGILLALERPRGVRVLPPELALGNRQEGGFLLVLSLLKGYNESDEN